MQANSENNKAMSQRSLNKLWQLFDEYAAEVNASNLTDSSKKDYIMFAEQFVRWIDGDFTPRRLVK